MDKKQYKNLYQIIFFIVLIPFMAVACRISTTEILPTVESIKQSPTVETYLEPTSATDTPAILEPTIIPTQTSDLDLSDPNEKSLIDLYLKINPSVANIVTYLISDEGEAYLRNQGSGFIFDENGHIVTNAHVVHGSDQVDVAFSDGTVISGEIIGQDLHSDLAVISVGTQPAGASPIPLGYIENVAVGQTVIAIGNPFGLGGTLTRGIVSAKGRTIPALTPFSIPQSIQTDAAINPGNSGGPLLNLDGEVIGVNAQIQTDGFNNTNQGVGFAIPVNILKRVVPELIQNGDFTWPWLGVQGLDLSPTIAEAMNIDTYQGAYMTSIVEDGPAFKAGLLGSTGTEKVRGRTVPTGGDVIVAIDDQPIMSFDDLLIYVSLHSSPGDEIFLSILRDGEILKIPIILEARPITFDP